MTNMWELTKSRPLPKAKMGRSSVVTSKLNVSNLTTTTLIGSFWTDKTQTGLVLDSLIVIMMTTYKMKTNL